MLLVLPSPLTADSWTLQRQVECFRNRREVTAHATTCAAYMIVHRTQRGGLVGLPSQYLQWVTS